MTEAAVQLRLRYQAPKPPRLSEAQWQAMKNRIQYPNGLPGTLSRIRAELRQSQNRA